MKTEKEMFAERQAERVTKYHDALHERIDKYRGKAHGWAWVFVIYVLALMGFQYFWGDLTGWKDIAALVIEVFFIWRVIANAFKAVRARGEHKGLMRGIEFLAIDQFKKHVVGMEIHITKNGDGEPEVEVRPIMRGVDTNNEKAGSATLDVRREFVIHDIDWKAEREKAGLSQKALAKKAKVSERVLRQIEKNWKVVGLGSVYKVAEALGYDMSVPRFGFQDVPVDKTGGKPVE